MKQRRRPRAVTLTLPDGKQPWLWLGEEKFFLRNFSAEGLGIWIPRPVPYGLTPGTRVSGDIVIGSDIHPVKLEVVHHSERIAGLRILHRSETLSEVFRKMLEPAEYAAELEAKPDPGTEDRDTGRKRLWFQSHGGTELVVWYEAERVISALQLLWLGKWVFRERNQSPLTGFLVADAHAGTGRSLLGSDAILPQTPADAELLQQAAQFLAAAPPPLPGYLLWQFLETGEQVHLPAEAFGRKAKVG